MTPIQLRADNDLDPCTLRDAFGTFPTGVVAVAAEVDGRLVGFAASSFTPVSLDPALVALSIATSSQTWPVLRRSPHLGLTILAEHHGPVCRQLAGPSERRFEGLEVNVSPEGAVTLDEGVGRFDCTIHQEFAAGDHSIVLLNLHSVEHSSGLPLVFHRSGFGRLVG